MGNKRQGSSAEVGQAQGGTDAASTQNDVSEGMSNKPSSRISKRSNPVLRFSTILGLVLTVAVI